jgi:GNAT superfamily N-acetyltransferase
MDAAAELARAHWAETEAGLMPEGPSIAIELYQALEQADALIAFGAFDADELVGYAVAILGLHLHYRVLYAQHDLLFVRPDHRRGTLGLRLMRAIETALKARGAKFVVWHAKPQSTFNMILVRTGYAVEETVYRKDL